LVDHALLNHEGKKKNGLDVCYESINSMYQQTGHTDAAPHQLIVEKRHFFIVFP
jgi:hypothetical protein